jgi:putative cell wall-binding protein
MKKQLNEIKRMQQLAGLITESEYQPAIYNDIEQDLMNGGFESTEDQVEYLQDIIKFCQEKIKEISGGLNENQPAIYNDKENIVNFLNANTKEFISKLGNPGSKFENLGDPKVATAGKSDTSGIDVSFDREHMLKLFPKDDPYNKVEEIEIAGKKIYYNDYR